MERRCSPRGVQNKLHAAEEAAAATAAKEELLAMRHDGVLRSDGGGRPCSVKWLAAAKAAMELLPFNVPATQHPTQLRAAL